MTALAVCVLCILLLPACRSEDMEQEAAVRFFVGGELAACQQVTVGECPQKFQPDLRGASFAGWLSAEGEPVAPETTAVYADTDYYARVYPSLSKHVPFLFADETGSIRPDDSLTGEDLRTALLVLAAEGAERYFPQLPEGYAEIDARSLHAILEAFFDSGEVSRAFGEKNDGMVSRARFVGIMNRLLRREEETVALTEPSELPKDLRPDRQDVADIMEASLPHTQDLDGFSWQDALLHLTWEPGFVHIDGWLYYAEETGKLVCNTQVNGLWFGEDGRYSSGDEELDVLVAGLLEEIITQNPDQEPIDWLYQAYAYCRDEIFYVPRDLLNFGETGWEPEMGKAALQDGVGNCYGYAGAFCMLARGLGYDAWGVSGFALEDRGPHGWVEIQIDGTNYVFDPEVERQYMAKRDDLNLFCMTYSKADGWLYIRPKRAE